MDLTYEINNQVTNYNRLRLDLLGKELEINTLKKCYIFDLEKLNILYSYKEYFDDVESSDTPNNIEVSIELTNDSINYSLNSYYLTDRFKKCEDILNHIKSLEKNRPYVSQINHLQKEHLPSTYPNEYLNHVEHILIASKKLIVNLSNRINHLSKTDCEYITIDFNRANCPAIEINKRSFKTIHFFNRESIISEIKDKIISIYRQEKCYLEGKKKEFDLLIIEQEKKIRELNTREEDKKHRKNQERIKKQEQQERQERVRKKEEQRKNQEKREYKKLAEGKYKKAQEKEKQRKQHERKEQEKYKRLAEEKTKRSQEREAVRKRKKAKIEAEKKETERKEYELYKKLAIEKAQAEARQQELKIQGDKAAEIEYLQLERERLRIEETRLQREYEAQQEQKRQDHELKKMLLMKEIEEMKLKREQADRQGFENMTSELNKAIKSD